MKRFLTGGLDEVAIYPRLLAAKEVRENYDAGGEDERPRHVSGSCSGI
jgi:hypothetical protein